MRAQGVIWDRKLTKLNNKFIDLRAWGLPGSDLRTWGLIWERKFIKLGNKLIDLRAWERRGVI